MATKSDLAEVFRHIEVTNGELGSVKANIAEIRADIRWLKTFIPPLMGLTAVLAGIITKLLGG